ncbi:TPA: hypothetical protein HA246_00790 [Candidatus Woesearchaeota archaeon]|nr:hypothetical protein [Candidatus Woesearchaeota archaeon]
MAKKKKVARAVSAPVVSAPVTSPASPALKTYERNLGHLAFIAGVIVAIIAGISSSILEEHVVTLVLVVLGLVVGFMNITSEEYTGFLVAAIALMVAGVADVLSIPYVGEILNNILRNIAKFVAPAALVVALKAVKKLAEYQ